METAEALRIFRKGLEPFAVFNEAEWIVFIQHLGFKIIKKKRYFIEPGETCNEVGFIVKGSVRFYHVKDGEEITGYFCLENDFVTSYKSFLTRQPGTHYIQALEDVELITISYKNMQLMFNNPMLAYKMERFGRLIAEHYLICYEDRMTSFIIKTPEERYLDLLASNRDIFQRIPQHYIANFLGITPVSLSRIRRRILEPAK
jgi:CRP-like cAMP-binding protein